METKEVRITPPEGYEVDKEKSTFDCIKFKKVVKRWRDDKNKSLKGFFMNAESTILPYSGTNVDTNYNVFAEEKQAKSALAMACISQIMANDERFGGVITDEEWRDPSMLKYGIGRSYNRIEPHILHHSYEFLAFHTREQRDLFLEENEDLVKDYLMIV